MGGGWAERHGGGPLGLALVLAVMLVLALPGFFSLPPVDRDEVLFSQASRQMVQSGDYIDIRFGDEARYKKPVGIYWLQSAAVAVTGQDGAIWSYRLVSLAGAMVAVGFTWAMARGAVGPGGAVLAGAVLASAMMLGAEARLAKTDAVLLATITAGQWAIWRLWAGQADAGRRVPAVFWGAMALGILVKGPIAPMVAGFTLAGLSLWRRDLALLRGLRPLPGLAALVLLVAPWFLAITWTSDGAFWAASVGRDLVGKLAEGQENHGAPPGTYLALIWATFWPGSMLLAAALPGIWAARRSAFVPLAVVWIVPTWVVFELTATKLVHYTLPVYPALAVLVALGLAEGRIWRWAAWGLAAVPVLAAAALPLAAGQVGLALPWMFWPLAVLAVLAGLAVPLALARGGMALVGALALAGLGLAGMVYPVLARVPGLWPARDLAALAAAHPGCDLVVAGYAEPSLVFWTDRAAVLASVDEARAVLETAAPGQSGCHLVALPAAEAVGQAPVARVTGLDLGRGKPLDLAVYLTGN